MANTLVYRIDEINMQVGKFLKNIKPAGQNRRAGGEFSGKSINVQGQRSVLLLLHLNLSILGYLTCTNPSF